MQRENEKHLQNTTEKTKRAEQAYSDIYILSSQKLFNPKKTFAVNNIIILIAKI